MRKVEQNRKEKKVKLPWTTGCEHTCTDCPERSSTTSCKGRPKFTWLKTVFDDLFGDSIIVNVRNPEDAINTNEHYSR